MKHKTCIVISGPTAVGKTDHAIEIAKKYNTEIISADSRQCYKELNIGVAKPSPEQLKIVPHYFINSHSIHDDVNVKVFEQYALDAINKICETNDVAVMVGGTGLYIKAFCDGIDDLPLVNENIRDKIIKTYYKKGIEWLQKEIKNTDHLYSSFVSWNIKSFRNRLIFRLTARLRNLVSVSHKVAKSLSNITLSPLIS